MASRGQMNNSVTFLTSIPAGSLLRNLKVKSLNDFKKLVQSKPGAGTDKAGALILQGIIIKKFKTQIPKGSPDLAKRLSYFKSANFLNNFTTDIPSRDRWDENMSETSYTAWFNTLFSVSFSDWREDKLIVTGNPEQCKRALYGNSKPNTNPRCYLCGDLFLKDHGTKECEHVLPIVSALSHLWLTQERIEKYTGEEKNALRLEYDWAHKCCNRIKSNYEFVILNYKQQRYDLNIPLIETYYDHLRDSEKYDCSSIKLKNIPPSIRNALNVRLEGITRIINDNIQSLGSLDMYHLLIKFKVLSAFTDDVFLGALTGNGEAVIRRSVDPVKRKKSREENARNELYIKQLEEETFSYKKQAGERRKLKYSSTMVGGNGDTLINVVNPNQQANADITDNEFAPFDEDLTFPVSFLRLIGMPEDAPFDKIDEYVLNYILTSPRYEPTEEQVDEFLTEQGVLSPTIYSTAGTKLLKEDKKQASLLNMLLKKKPSIRPMFLKKNPSLRPMFLKKSQGRTNKLSRYGLTKKMLQGVLNRNMFQHFQERNNSNNNMQRINENNENNNMQRTPLTQQYGRYGMTGGKRTRRKLVKKRKNTRKNNRR